ncbi:helix-turn-helix domain-containing protein [Marinactinospora rubrisoli]|uniref:Helix-turn-helix domain-containing protein n=1 Tax=Marinactinospora rubrisoli TaxID=2715399 RepID=A0ABW2KNC0_9ACTN
MSDMVRPQWARLGREIRRLRKQAGLSQGQLGKSILVSHGMISAIERGVRGVRPEHVERIDQVLSTGGALTLMWDAISRSHDVPDWFRDVASLEKTATEIREYHPVLVPGLLQTEDYARAVVRSGRPADTDVEIDGIVEARMDRKSIFRKDRPPYHLVVLDEMVIRRPVGGHQTMRDQLGRLLEVSADSRVVIQIIPFATTHHPGLSGPFRLLQDTNGNDVLYVEHAVSGMYVENRELLQECVRVYGELRAVALRPGESRALIEKAMDEFQ